MTGRRGAIRQVLSRSPAETRRIGFRLGLGLCPGAVVSMDGDLGSGKTCLAQGICEGCGVRGPVTSPTFTLINEYDGRVPVYHIDCYRIQSARELWRLGVPELLESGGITLVEWADRVPECWPPERHVITLAADAARSTHRRIRMQAP